MRVGLAQHLPYDVILRRDWPEFIKLVRGEVEREAWKGEEKTKKTLKKTLAKNKGGTLH